MRGPGCGCAVLWQRVKLEFEKLLYSIQQKGKRCKKSAALRLHTRKKEMTPDQHLTTVLSGVTSVHSYYLTSLINLSFYSLGGRGFYVLKIWITSGRDSVVIIIYTEDWKKLASKVVSYIGITSCLYSKGWQALLQDGIFHNFFAPKSCKR